MFLKPEGWGRFQ